MIPDGKGHWVSRDRLVYYYKPLDLKIYVPAGAINDLASVPWFFKRIFPINGPSRPAAALHDYLYQTGGNLIGAKLTRKQCDEIFMDAMLSPRSCFWNAYPKFVQDYLCSLGFKSKFFNSNNPLVDKLSAKLMYLGVRLGGWLAFGKGDNG